VKAHLPVVVAVTLALGSHRSQFLQTPAGNQPAVRPTTYELIDRALAAGQINSETAYKYRVFAAFGDSRLPAAFRGVATAAHPEPPATVLEATELNTFSQQSQAELAPFFMRPDAPGSWITLSTVAGQAPGSPPDERASHSLLRPAARLSRSPMTHTRVSLRSTPDRARRITQNQSAWITYPAANGKAKVWAQRRYPGDDAKAQGLANALTNVIWDKLVAYMGVLPAADSNIAMNGGDNALDFYLVHAPSELNPATGTRGPAWHGVAMPAISFIRCLPMRYILIDSSLPLGNETSPGIVQVAAHELMHTLTMRFRTVDNGGCGAHWIMEASGTWAENFVYPQSNGEHKYANDLQNSPHYSLEDEKPLRPGGTCRCYAAYLLPLFVERTGSSDFMHAMWSRFRSEPTLKAINSVLGGGWDKQWPEFLVKNWNRPPIDQKSYTAWDQYRTPALQSTFTVNASAGPHKIPLDLPARTSPTGGLEYLSGWFYNFTMDPSVHTVTFENTLAVYHPKHASLWAIPKINGNWQQPQDWTDSARMTFCRDLPSENVSDLIIIIGNADWETKKVLNPPVPPSLTGYRQGCSAWEGADTVTFTMSLREPNVTITERLVATLKFESDTAFIRPGQPRGYWKLTAGTANWTATQSGDCTGSGSASVALTGAAIGDEVPRLDVWNEGRDLVYQGHDAPWPDASPPVFTITCRNGVTTQQILHLSLGWWNTDDANNKVSADGRTIKGAFADSTSTPGIRTTWSYELHLRP